MTFYSQIKQDKILNDLFGNKRNGVFIDIGANDGITFSNSYFFETELDWTGICVEPIPDTFEKLKQNRKCILENCAISDAEGLFDFIYIEGKNEMLSGFNRKDYASKNEEKYKLIKVQTFRLDTILSKHNIFNADFCSIDVEGTELAVIKSVNWELFNIQYLCIEENGNRVAIQEYLEPYYEKHSIIQNQDILLKRK